MGNLLSIDESKFQPKGDYAITRNVYSKSDVDVKFQPKGEYVVAGNVYLKTEADGKFQPKGEYALIQNVYNKTDVDSRFQPKGVYGNESNSIWCAEGDLCNLPLNKTGIKMGDYTIRNMNNRLCIVSPQDTYCYDGKIVTKQ